MWILAASGPIEQLIWTEWAMIAVFVIGVVTWGILMRKSGGTLEGSFLADRKVPGFIGSLSTVATNLNANDFLGGAGMAYGFGLIVVHHGWANGLGLILVALFIMPKLRRLNVMTLGGWLEKRYSTPVGVAYSVIWSLVWMLFNLGLYLYAGALVLNTLVGWDLNTSIVVLSIIAAFYTLIGGFRAVVATDVLQIALMFFPFIFLSVAVLWDIGGITGIAQVIPADKGGLWRSDTPFGHYVVMVLGCMMMGMSYWSCEAQVVQRPLASRSEEDASVMYLGASFWLGLLMPFLVMLPALAALHYFPGLEKNDLAMPMLIRKFLPHGLYGVMIVGLIAGVFSSADSQINAFCAMFTNDLFKRFIVPGRSESFYVKASKVLGVVFTLSAIGTAFIFKYQNEGMLIFAISVLATIMPPFAAITILGTFWRKAHGTAALIGLISGGAVAVALVILDYQGSLKPYAEQTLFLRVLITFPLTMIVTVVMSALIPGKPIPATEAVDIDTRLPWKLVVGALALAAGMGGLLLFWTHYFHKPIGILVN